MANIITSFRILCSIMLLFFTAFSPSFYFLYLLCGFSDMIDGTVARKTHSVSELGSKLDTVADFIFVVVALVKLLPKIDTPTWLLIWIGLIAVIKIVNLFLGFTYYRRFVAVHTVMNKVIGFFLFMLPLTLFFIEMKYSSIILCSVATFAAIQEGYFIRN